MSTLAVFLPGHWEIIILVAVILLLFFGNRIPRLARDFGRSIVEFKAGLAGRKDRPAEGERDGPDEERGR